MVLTSGTEEVVCLRERESQTLWMSETLDVSRGAGSLVPWQHQTRRERQLSGIGIKGGEIRKSFKQTCATSCLNQVDLISKGIRKHGAINRTIS